MQVQDGENAVSDLACGRAGVVWRVSTESVERQADLVFCDFTELLCQEEDRGGSAGAAVA